jgi:hypothetical protein
LFSQVAKIRPKKKKNSGTNVGGGSPEKLLCQISSEIDKQDLLLRVLEPLSILKILPSYSKVSFVIK